MAGFDRALLAILACPADDHGALSYDETNERLTCTRCGREFVVDGGIPVMLLAEGDDGSAHAGQDRGDA